MILSEESCVFGNLSGSPVRKCVRCATVTRCLKYWTEDGGCQTYKCLAEHTGCPSVDQSVAYKFCIAVHASQAHSGHQQHEPLLHSHVRLILLHYSFLVFFHIPDSKFLIITKCPVWFLRRASMT